MPNKVDSWGLIVSRDVESPDRIQDLQSLLQQVLGSLLQHETYHLPTASAKTKSGCSLEDSSL